MSYDQMSNVKCQMSSAAVVTLHASRWIKVQTVFNFMSQRNGQVQSTIDHWSTARSFVRLFYTWMRWRSPECVTNNFFAPSQGQVQSVKRSFTVTDLWQKQKPSSRTLTVSTWERNSRSTSLSVVGYLIVPFSGCWLDLTRGRYESALATRQMETFLKSKAFHAVLWPVLGFSSSIFCCSTFWWKNRKDVLKFTQSG